MAGHSQFKNIMHRKGAQDAKRAKLFTKLGRELTVAAKEGGDDPDSNPRLRTAIINARSKNMPKDNMERAIKRGLGGGGDNNYESMRYEGYGPSGIAIIVEALTENRNRTASEIRTIFTKLNGNMGETGSVSFMFDHMGHFHFPFASGSHDEVFDKALDAGAEDIESNAEGHNIYCSREKFTSVREDLEKSLENLESSALIWKPKTIEIIKDEEKAKAILRLIDALEDNDDVQNVYANFSFSPELEKIIT